MAQNYTLKELASEIRRLSQLTATLPNPLPNPSGRSREVKNAYVQEYNRLRAKKNEL